MGLGFTWKNCNMVTAHWSYGGFMHFRKKLALEIEIILDDMKGFGGEKNWKGIKSPLKYFLNHSDCDGRISPKRCKEIVDAMKNIITKWPNDDYDKEQAQILIKNMNECFKNNDYLIFC